MKQHKWHKEIKAWADGAEIEYWSDIYQEWSPDNQPYWNSDTTKFRIKPQPKEPQYLYVYLDDNYEFSPIKLNTKWKFIGKIKIEVED